MKKVMFMLMTTAAIAATNPVSAMLGGEEELDTPAATQVQLKIAELEAENRNLSEKFNGLAAIQFQNRQNPKLAFDMNQLEEKIWYHRLQHLNLTLEMVSSSYQRGRESQLLQERGYVWCAYSRVREAKVHYAHTGEGHNIVYCDYHSCLLQDDVWGTYPGYNPSSGELKK